LNDLKEGTGRIVWDDQSEFHGQFESNEMHFGSLSWFDDKNNFNRYLGIFKNSKITSKGSLHTQNK